MAVRRTLVLLSAAVLTAGSASGEGLVVIVHSEQEATLSLDQIAQVYLKKRRFWGNGDRVVPVNRDAGSRARDAFVRSVFGERARQLIVYWNREYFRGVLPPVTLASDEAVKRFVASERRAIGYIDPRLVDDSIRVMFRLEFPR